MPRDLSGGCQVLGELAGWVDRCEVVPQPLGLWGPFCFDGKGTSRRGRSKSNRVYRREERRSPSSSSPEVPRTHGRVRYEAR